MVTLRIKNLDAVLSQFKLSMGSRPTVRIGISVSGPAAAYALVWEWGRVDCNPGPKTLWGVNPDGETVVMTKTAPNGFIRINRDKYGQYVREEMLKINWRGTRISQIPKKVETALQAAAVRSADLMAETAPVDTGDLRAALRSFVMTDNPEEDTTQDFIAIRTRIHRLK